MAIELTTPEWLKADLATRKREASEAYKAAVDKLNRSKDADINRAIFDPHPFYPDEPRAALKQD